MVNFFSNRGFTPFPLLRTEIMHYDLWHKCTFFCTSSIFLGLDIRHFVLNVAACLSIFCLPNHLLFSWSCSLNNIIWLSTKYHKIVPSHVLLTTAGVSDTLVLNMSTYEWSVVTGLEARAPPTSEVSSFIFWVLYPLEEKTFLGCKVEIANESMSPHMD